MWFVLGYSSKTISKEKDKMKKLCQARTPQESRIRDIKRNETIFSSVWWIEMGWVSTLPTQAV